MTEDFLKDIYKEAGDDIKYEHFMNSINYGLGGLMQSELSSFQKENYFEKLDRLNYLDLNKFTKDLPIVELFLELDEYLQKKKNAL